LRVIRLTLLLALLGAAVPAGARAQATAPTPDPSAPAGPVAVNAQPNAILGRAVRFAGRVDPAAAGRPVTIERFDSRTTAWAPEANSAVAPDGSFTAAWPAEETGRFRMRAVVQGGAEAAAASASQELNVTVYQMAFATWYGPGFYRKRTACGQRMSRTLIGVAHRRLPCGTQVGLFYRGRTFVVPVVDRGPYSRAKWDLTSATARSIGFKGAEPIGVVPLGPGSTPGAPLAAPGPLPIGGGVVAGTGS
jgi:rare lipoprotein A